jgi:hypothetical protein
VNAYHVPHCARARELLRPSRAVIWPVDATEEPPVNYFADELNEARYTPEAIRTLGAARGRLS